MKINLKSVVVGFIFGGIFFSGIATATTNIKQVYFNNDITIQVEGKNIDVQPLTVVTDDNPNGVTYLPLRKVAQAVGKSVEWNNDTKTANIVSNEEAISISTTNTNTTIITSVDDYGLKYIEKDGEKYVNAVDLNIYCKEKGFSFSVGGLMDDTTHYGIHSKDQTKTANLSGTIDVYRFNHIPYFKYSFFTDTILPFMEENK
jgi:hypothetical protein